MENESVYTLAVKCADKQLSPPEFLNLYKEFFNEKYASHLDADDNQNPDTKSSEIAENIASEFVKLFNTEKSLLIADYVVHTLFINYNTELVHAFLPKLGELTGDLELLHFFSRISSFLSQLSDRIILNQLNNDLSTCILPELLNVNVARLKDEVVIALCKLLQLLLKISNTPVVLAVPAPQENAFALLKRLAVVNKLLHKRLYHALDSKLSFSDSKSFLPQHEAAAANDYISSPSITSPLFISSPTSISKQPETNGSMAKYQDMRILRYYKNLWLNSKIMNWASINQEFLTRYMSIPQCLFEHSTAQNLSFDSVLTDLIETSFTCFAQFVSNKQYHQSNANFNLLEKQWTIFISKHLPLLIMDYSSGNPQVVATALEKIDDKVIKAIRTYYSEKDDTKNRNEDLFDDYPSVSLDIRHDFIKNLIMLGLQPPTFMNEYLREDQRIDVRTLQITDELVIENQQGVQETVRYIPEFLKTSLDSIELESFASFSSKPQQQIIQVLYDFENIPPTKQRELSHNIILLFEDAINKKNYLQISKISCCLSYNFAHSLTIILSFVTPERLAGILMTFIDSRWDGTVDARAKGMDDPEYETTNIFLSLGWALVLLLTVTKSYEVSLVDIALKLEDLDIDKSFTIPFVIKLSEISDTFSLGTTGTINEGDSLLASQDTVVNWLKDIFVNGSISDSLVQNIDAKQLSYLLPHIFKQIILGIEIDAITDIPMIIGGLDYFLQPFMLIGLIKIIYWLEEYLYSLTSDEKDKAIFANKMLPLLNSLFNPATLNPDSKAFHNAVIRLNAVGLLKVFRMLKSQSQVGYRTYSSETQGNPVLEDIITKLLDVLSISPIYNTDPRVINLENSYPSQKQLGYGKFLILNEMPTNKIMSNQMNSFWNLHSSTYYNLDYLKEVIELVTPKKFFLDVIQTLEYKINSHESSRARNKGVVNSEHVIDYFFYFLALYDIRNQQEATEFIMWLETETLKPAEDVLPKNEAKMEQVPDDDFEMLFGENENSLHNSGDDTVNRKSELRVARSYALKRNSFGFILHQMKVQQYLALSRGDISKEDTSKINSYHQKYLSMLKKCVF